MKNDSVSVGLEPTAGGSDLTPQTPPHVLRRARGAVLEHLVTGRFSISEVQLLDSLGAECSARFGDADVLDQLVFRMRQRLERQLAIVAVVRRARGTKL